ncbi:helix-turn-helix transcriptional regulator [Adlercreutzia shanghongiae]|uniref:Helix-turn-helix transcriptional regulator n=1 Tax=Adlercreutzia shanghongiae TaxID=3111773 RepID=A0ABU6IYP9_9ACTN|nr:helix-turn-helix transcriptional regulator [Adlercreutzia sp. R22]MEC4294727.1 helix-turn-helix transcriptional regulator [Adlercreutzia sp. R22]
MPMLRTYGSLTLILLASTMLNTAIFPEVALASPWARDISTVCGAVFAIAVAVAAFVRPSLIRERIASLGLLALLLLSMALLCGGIYAENVPLVVAGSPFGGIGMVWFSVVLGVALTRLSRREALIAVGSAYVANYGIRLLLTLMGAPVPLFIAALLYCGAIAAAYRLIAPVVRDIFAALRAQEPPTVLDATNPSSFLPFSSFVYVTLIIFNAACGFEMAQTGGSLAPAWEAVSFLPVAIVLALALAQRPRADSLDNLHMLAALLVFAGLLLIPLRTLPADGINLAAMGPAVLLRSGSDVFAVLIYLLIAAIGARNPLGSLTAAAFAFAASWIGIVIGAAGPLVLDQLAAEGAEATTLATLFVTFIFVAYNFVALRHRSFDASVNTVVPAYAPAGSTETEAFDPSSAAVAPSLEHGLGEEGPSLSPESDSPSDDAGIERGCTAVAERFGLTSRESDVLALLARGRTSPVIQKKLTVSHNTVKSHVRHIYAKLDVHSQQELIDLVDELAAQ